MTNIVKFRSKYGEQVWQRSETAVLKREMIYLALHGIRNASTGLDWKVMSTPLPIAS